MTWSGGSAGNGTQRSRNLNDEAPSEKIELKIKPDFEAEMEPVIGGLNEIYITHILDVVLRLIELGK